MIKRRALSLALALVLVVCMIPVSAFAAQNLQTSNACVSVIKHFEGFSKYPYWDNGQYTIGYGTRCPSGKLSYYRTYGITESAAVALLNQYINSFESYVNAFANDNGLKLTQNQFDALMSFTFNVGPGWMNDEEGSMTRAVLDGAKGNDFIFAITMWSLAGGDIKTGLVERRLVEANMYLTGSYSTAVPESMGYVTFNYTDAVYEGERRTISIQGYDASLTDVVRPQAVRSGYRFLGWYTASSGGKWVSHLDANTSGRKLYARWQSGDGKVSNGVIQGTKASYERVVDGTVKVYAKPSTSSTVKYKLSDGSMISIVADYVTSGGVKWGKMSDGCWLQLSGTDPVLSRAASGGSQGTLVTVTTERLNVRSGPGTGYSRVRYAYEGEQIRITEVRDVNGTPWGKLSGGWICLDYTDYEDRGESVIATGTVSSSTGSLNVRAGAGTGYSKVGTLSTGDRVEIYEIVKVNGTEWGRISKGWISLDYVKLDGQTNQTPETGSGDNVVATGTVSSSTGSLNIRAGAGTGYSKVGTLSTGDRVEIYEIVKVNSTEWGRISKGWISLDYVKLDDDSGNDQSYVTGVVSTSADSLNIRSGPGVSYSIVGTLSDGTAVKIYEIKSVGSSRWGRIDKGWISMSYIRLDNDGGNAGSSTASAGGTRPGTVVNCTELNVRADAGTGYAKVGIVDVGEKVTVTDMKLVNSMVWGKISKGWISLYYVDLNDIAAGSLAMVDNSYLNIRSGPAASYSKVGTYYEGDVIVVLEIKKVGSDTWGKTEKGWISLEYVY